MRYYFTLLFFLIVALPVQANDTLNVTYGIYASGFNVLDMRGTYTITDDTYDLKMDMETAGLLGRVAPWAGVIHSNGLNKDGGATPLVHSFASTWREKIETTTFRFNKDGKLESYLLEEDDGTIKNDMPAPEVYKDNPTDMLSALFRVMNQIQTCESTHPAMDGKRRFDMVFTSKGFDMLEQSKYSVFEGEAEICDVEIVPVAGKWREKPRGWMSIQQQAKGKGQLPRLWFGKIREDMPAIPVRFLIKTNYGAMVMHLKNIES